MKNTTTLLIVLIVGVGIGLAISRWSSGPGDPAESSTVVTEREILYWKAPMDPNFRSDEPGKSPMGMELVPVYAGAGEDDESVVTISPQVVNNLGVRTEQAQYGVLSRRIDTVGYVGYDEDTLQHIRTRVDGWIERLNITATGDPVIKGQTLFELYSPTLVNAEEEYLTALRSGNLTLIRASGERLVALGVSTGEIDRLEKSRKVNQRLAVTAQIDGVVADLAVREGAYITPASDVMSIAKLDRVWVLAEVFERQSDWIQPGQRAEVELDYLPGKRLQGTVDYIYPELDLKTRTLKVRLRFDNKNDVFRPNMFARITIHGTETSAVVHVPREALIRGGATDRVVLALGDGKFRAQPVQIGIESGNRVEILSGIGTTDLVVTSGQFLIDSESNVESALARMDERVTDTPASVVTVAATVRGIDTLKQKLVLQHEPIAEWSWPAMTMGFAVENEHLLMGLEEGQSIGVTIEEQSGGIYVITAIESSGTSDGTSTSSANVAAVVRGIDATSLKLTLQHEPISKWSWPAMTMGFAVENEHLLMGLEEGQSVDVTIEAQADDTYVITAVTSNEAGRRQPESGQ
jgi:Cu(I)/Ag(I) efflux system membrane fusion protein